MATMLVVPALTLGAGVLLNFLFPKQGAQGSGQDQGGPRLNDLLVTSSTFGKSIPVHYGTVRVGGNIIWGPPLIEEARTSSPGGGGGKGGLTSPGGQQSTTSYNYFANFAVGFGEGVAEKVLRIWCDAVLVYDINQGGNLQDLNFRFYGGDESQLPDPLMEAEHGAGNVPAHRGLCYIMFERLALAPFGNRIPNITAEITYNFAGSFPFLGMTELSGYNPPGSTTGADTGSWFVIDPDSDRGYSFKIGSGGVNSFSTQSMTNTGLTGGTGVNAISFSMGLDGYIYMMDGSSNYESISRYDPYSLEKDTGFILGASASIGDWTTSVNRIPNWSSIGVIGESVSSEVAKSYVISPVNAGGGGGFKVMWFDRDFDISIGEGVTTVSQKVFNTASVHDIGRAGLCIHDRLNRRVLVLQESNSETRIWKIIGAGPGVDATQIGTIAKGGVDLAGTADIQGTCYLPNENAVILSNGVSMCKVSLDDGSVLASNLSIGFYSKENWSTDGTFVFPEDFLGDSQGAELIRISTSDLTEIRRYTMASWSFGDSANDSMYGRAVYDPRDNSIIISRIQGSPGPSTPTRVVKLFLDRGVGEGVPLGEVVADISDRVGFQASEYDVTDLMAQTVLGYTITQQMTGRNALEPLQRGYLFDGAESDFKMKFVNRGKDPVVTLDADYLGRLGNDDREEPVKEVRAQELELPSRVVIRYSSKEDDYEIGAQFSQRMRGPLPTQFAANELTLEIPVVFQVNTAKQLSERWLYTTWAERVSFESVTGWRYLYLDPTDVFEMVWREELRRLRMIKFDMGLDLSVEFTATQEDSRTNVSFAEGSNGEGRVPQVLPPKLPTNLFLLDLPVLFAVDDGNQLYSRGYVGMAGQDDSWPGATVFQSRDSGSNYDAIASASLETAWGIVEGTIPTTTNPFTWNTTATIILNVQRGMDQIQTATESEVLNGANAIAVIIDTGQVEIIQFTTVTVLSAAQVQVSGILRGRLGTEDVVGLHGSTEKWVLLTRETIQRIVLSLDILDAVLPYRAVTQGLLIEDATPINFAFTGNDLKPYPVCSIVAARATDITITWERRTRFNGEWRDGTGDVPLNEQTEEYDVEIYEIGQTAPFKSVTVTAKTATVTAAELSAEGLTVNSQIDVKIYQKSAVVGRGRALLTRI